MLQDVWRYGICRCAYITGSNLCGPQHTVRRKHGKNGLSFAGLLPSSKHAESDLAHCPQFCTHVTTCCVHRNVHHCQKWGSRLALQLLCLWHACCRLNNYRARGSSLHYKCLFRPAATNQKHIMTSSCDSHSYKQSDAPVSVQQSLTAISSVANMSLQPLHLTSRLLPIAKINSSPSPMCNALLIFCASHLGALAVKIFSVSLGRQYLKKLVGVC